MFIKRYKITNTEIHNLANKQIKKGQISTIRKEEGEMKRRQLVQKEGHLVNLL